LFSPSSNITPGISHDKQQLKEGEKHPEMLGRLMAGGFHPLIHVGYGAEFGVKQQIAEGPCFIAHLAHFLTDRLKGLAQTAVHLDYQTPTAPLYLFELADMYGRGLSKTPLPSVNAGPPPPLWLHHALANDPRLSPAALSLERPAGEDSINEGIIYFKVLQQGGPILMQLVNEWYDRWTVGVPEEELEDRLEKMVEDVIVGNVFWYAIPGFAARGKEAFNADFLVCVRACSMPHPLLTSELSMHFVTSSIFLPTLALAPGQTQAQTIDPPLPLASRLQLVRVYVASAAAWYIARYRPTASKLSIADFYAATSSKLSPPPATHAYAPGQAPPRNFWKNTQKTMPVGATAWPRLWMSAMVHPNEHLIKLVRALGACDRWYGLRGKGAYAGALQGAEELDGTVFLRAAVLTMDRLGWAYEEEPLALWDRHGYYDAVVGEDGVGM
jgi:hypothetical protein